MRSFRSECFLAVMTLSCGFACVYALAQTPQAQTQQTLPQAQPQQQKHASAQTKATTPPRPTARAITGVGSAPTQDDMGNLAWTAGPSGKDLPQGSGTAKQGAEV